MRTELKKNVGRQGRDKFTIMEAYRLHSKGMSYRQLASRYGCSVGAAFWWVNNDAPRIVTPYMERKDTKPVNDKDRTGAKGCTHERRRSRAATGWAGTSLRRCCPGMG